MHLLRRSANVLKNMPGEIAVVDPSVFGVSGDAAREVGAV
jgi:hypothetical protein